MFWSKRAPTGWELVPSTPHIQLCPGPPCTQALPHFIAYAKEAQRSKVKCSGLGGPFATSNFFK